MQGLMPQLSSAADTPACRLALATDQQPVQLNLSMHCIRVAAWAALLYASSDMSLSKAPSAPAPATDQQPAQLVRHQRVRLLAGVHTACGEQRGQRGGAALRHARASPGQERVRLLRCVQEA